MEESSSDSIKSRNVQHVGHAEDKNDNGEQPIKSSNHLHQLKEKGKIQEERKKTKDKKRKHSKREKHHSHRHHDDDNDDHDDDEIDSDYSDDDDDDDDEKKKERKKRRKERKKEDRENRKKRKLEKKLKKLNEKAEKKKQKAGIKELISEDDYFRKSVEFREWLKEEKNVLFFEDIESTKDAKELFKRFISKWNGGKLDQRFYNGTIEVDADVKTKHNWNLKMGDADIFEMENIHSRVKRQNIISQETTNERESSLSKDMGKMPISETESKHLKRNITGYNFQQDKQDFFIPSKSREKNLHDLQNEIDVLPDGRVIDSHDKRKHQKYKDKIYQKRRKEDLEEIMPKPDAYSFEARLEKKRLANSISKQNEDRYDDEMNQVDLMGGDDTEFQRLKKREQQWKERKNQERTNRIHELQAKENERNKQFQQQLGLFKKKFESKGKEQFDV